MPTKDIIVVGTSTGGMDALKVLVSELPRDLKASIFIVLHTASYSLGILPEILERAGPLPASNATDWEQFKAGHIYVAPPDHHLLLERAGYTRITRGPKENRFRPAVDPLFRSAARAFGPRVVGVIMTGWLDDGTAGLWAVKERGGTAIVQRPDDALAPSMPLSAIRHVQVDYSVPLKEIAPLLVRLTGAPAEEEGAYPMSDQMETEVRIAGEENGEEIGILKFGKPSIYACPECHGVLLQLEEGNNIRFRCHTGHAYSVDSLLSEFTERSEETLWSTIRSLEESVLLLRDQADHVKAHGDEASAEALLKKAQESRERAEMVRLVARQHEKLSTEKLEQAAEEA
jgi:two-component system chemotaxis response regulator CheB